MLKLINIVKDYVSGNNVTHALKGLSINFRRNEFVAILGPSGCGKTTLLNITGGLDRYTSGDLIIEGKSTKNYKDVDWDTYRNHSIGFVFQTYNLIMHQSIAKNVELALTISGIGKAERKERAEKALELVGLGGLGKKRPNQLSGGQMQRVAIARALVNNPEIVMADEPTGALDSETSIQIMDILQEVAKDRLVVMVTHNPELAQKYATRIIKMKDGVILSDSNPYDGESEEERKAAQEARKDLRESKGAKKQSSMSFATATGLSFSNLVSKLKRTILVTIAGSIGIIGVSAVLAVSQGVTDYIGRMQNDMLSAYPVSVEEKSVDLTSLLSGLSTAQAKESFVFDPKDPKVGMDSMVDYLMTAYSDVTNVKTNEINDELVDFIDHVPSDRVFSIFKQYGIDPTNDIFTTWVSDPIEEGKPKHTEVISLNGLTQRYIAELKTVEGFSNYASYVNLFTSFMDELPGDKDYLLSQYDVLGESVLDESVEGITLVVDQDTTLTDLILAQLGIYEHDEFLNIAKRAIKINELPDNLSPAERKAEIEKIEAMYPYRRTFEYEELIGREFLYIPQANLYKNGTVKETEVTVSGNIISMEAPNQFLLPYDYDEVTDSIVGTLMKLEGSGYSFEQVQFMRVGEKPASVESKKFYMAGEWTCQDSNGDEKYHLSVSADLTTFTMSKNGETPFPVIGTVSEESHKVEGYHYKAELPAEIAANPQDNGGFRMKIKGILRLKEEKSFGCMSRGVYYTHAFSEKYIEDSNSISNMMVQKFKNYFGSEAQKTKQYDAYVTFDYFDFSDKDNPPVKKSDYASALNGDLSNSFSDLFSSITGVNYVESDKVHLRSVCGMKAVDISGEGEEPVYQFEQLPYSIYIYPKNFADKKIVTDYLDKWNSDQTIRVFEGTPQQKDLTPKDRAELTYTDTIELIVTVINTLITAVTIALVAFTSLALVVSSFMIAVITYISVVERTKEIGIIRSVGGRKKDVSRLFIAETFMTGLFSGIFGLIFTYTFEIIFNIAMKGAFGIAGLANLTIPTALIMLGISVLLSVLSGLIPSMKASRQDPVIALRSGE